MKIGIVLSTKDEEKAYNAFRFGNHALKKCHDVSIFLLGEGVEAEEIEGKKFNVKEQIISFADNNGCILACGSCLKIRQKGESNVCPISTMEDLMMLVEKSDKVLTFG
ncbi:MAG: DsrE family protein [Nanoarchaeota archaeon]|nr:DsrE family protein [Nanoarchaeota archaeon]MBU1005721.1 DsrE family protein [Nanoarchaeota archaeon]MBU1945594.1 DsrE family protein [Nanoarchaeota archaeon]